MGKQCTREFCNSRSYNPYVAEKINLNFCCLLPFLTKSIFEQHWFINNLTVLYYSGCNVNDNCLFLLLEDREITVLVGNIEGETFFAAQTV